jgi:DNA-binding transcriptional MerR regulator
MGSIEKIYGDQNGLGIRQQTLDLSITIGSIVNLVMLSVSQIARQFGLSRTAVLYYESVGLLKPAHRSAARYRLYGKKEIELLRQICLYRSVGLSVRDIGRLLSGTEGGATAVLNRRLVELEAEIGELRRHQQAIVKLLQARKSLSGRTKDMTKEKWTSIMKAAGFTEDDMKRWHQEFERAAPDDHQEFLNYLHIAPEEIRHIRDWSRTGESKH